MEGIKDVLSEPRMDGEFPRGVNLVRELLR